MVELLMPLVVGAVAGGMVAALVAMLLLRHHQTEECQADDPDPWTMAEIDRAAVEYATRHGRPEAAGLLADKLHLLHRLGLHQKGGPR